LQKPINYLIRVSSPWTVLLGCDLLIAVGLFYVSTAIRFDFDLALARSYLGAVFFRALAFGFWVTVGMVSMGMYRTRQRPRLWELVARIIVAVTLGSLAYLLFFYLISADITGRGLLAIAMLLVTVCLSAAHWYLLRLADFNTDKRRILILGAGRVAGKIGMLRRRADRRRFEVVGYVPANEQEVAFAEELGLSPLLSLQEGIKTLRPDKLVIALDDRRGAFPARELLELKFSGVPVEEVVDFLEAETEKIDLDVLHPGWLVFAATRHTDRIFLVSKRCFDLAAGSLLLFLAAPLFLLCMLAIKIEDGVGASVFYRQSRVGRHDRIFSLLKFRSMVTDAERDGARWSAGARDSRVTRTGKVIRRFRIDELPQVINVLRGDMSIVGPRPERPEFVEQLTGEVPFYDHRHCVRPGLTGWAQLNFPYGASVEDAREKLKYDLYYIKNANLVFDLFVLLQTLEVVLWGKAVSMAGPREPGSQQGTTAEQAQVRLIRERKQDTAA